MPVSVSVPVSVPVPLSVPLALTTVPLSVAVAASAVSKEKPATQNIVSQLTVRLVHGVIGTAAQRLAEVEPKQEGEVSSDSQGAMGSRVWVTESIEDPVTQHDAHDKAKTPQKAI